MTVRLGHSLGARGLSGMPCPGASGLAASAPEAYLIGDRADSASAAQKNPWVYL